MIRFTTSNHIIKAKKIPGIKGGKIANINLVANNMQRAAVFSFSKGISTFKRRIPTDQLARAYATGNFDEIMRLFPFDKLNDDMSGMRAVNEQSLIRASQASISVLPAPARKLRFDPKNPRIAEFIDKNVGNLVVAITDNTRKVVQQTVTNSFNNALTPKRAAIQIKSSIGLTPKQGQALEKFSAGLEAAGIKGPRLNKQVEAYSQRIRRTRAITIARTEIQRAVNAGQLEVWRQAGEKGLIDIGTARKQWVSTVDDVTSDICVDLDGEIVLVDAQFFVAETGESIDGPPAHINCRAGLILLP